MYMYSCTSKFKFRSYGCTGTAKFSTTCTGRCGTTCTAVKFSTAELYSHFKIHVHVAAEFHISIGIRIPRACHARAWHTVHVQWYCNKAVQRYLVALGTVTKYYM